MKKPSDLHVKQGTIVLDISLRYSQFKQKYCLLYLKYIAFCYRTSCSINVWLALIASWPS